MPHKPEVGGYTVSKHSKRITFCPFRLWLIYHLSSISANRLRTEDLGNGLLELPELKMLIDAVQASKFLTYKQLIQRLIDSNSKFKEKNISRYEKP